MSIIKNKIIKTTHNISTPDYLEDVMYNTIFGEDKTLEILNNNKQPTDYIINKREYNYNNGFINIKYLITLLKKYSKDSEFVHISYDESKDKYDMEFINVHDVSEEELKDYTLKNIELDNLYNELNNHKKHVEIIQNKINDLKNKL